MTHRGEPSKLAARSGLALAPNDRLPCIAAAEGLVAWDTT
jgi:hypothetical protein